jgi:hypothetical protein
VPIALLVQAADISLVRLVGVTGRKRAEADVIAGPAWMLEGCTFAAATGAARTSAQLIAWGIRPPPDDGDRASERRVMLTPLAPYPYPRRRSL